MSDGEGRELSEKWEGYVDGQLVNLVKEFLFFLLGGHLGDMFLLL